MGRGRAKAKQTKVARALKYSTPQTDWERLQAELGNPPSGVATDGEPVEDEHENDEDAADDEGEDAEGASA